MNYSRPHTLFLRICSILRGEGTSLLTGHVFSNHFFAKVGFILLLVFSLNIITDGCFVQPAQAATMTAAQKAKAQRAKQAAKKKKAAQKARAKEAAKRKAAASRTSSSRTSSSSSRTASAPRNDAKSSYEEKLATAEKWNEHVARYMSRDISHRLGFWGQAGYSSLLMNNVAFDAENNLGFTPHSDGWIGGGGGLGYQLRYRSFLLTTGLEFQMYDSHTAICADGRNPLHRTFAMEPYSSSMTYRYEFAEMKDIMQAGYLQLPLLFGMEFGNHDWYFQAGPKIGLAMLAASQIRSTVNTTITDSEIFGLDGLGIISDAANHALVTGREYTTDSRHLNLDLNLALVAEVGHLWHFSPMNLGVALFAEYGVLNINSSSNFNSSLDDIPAQLSPVVNNSSAHPLNDLHFEPSLAVSAAQDARLNPLLVGVKLTLMWDLPRKELSPVALPKEPSPRMMVQVVDADTDNGLAAASISIWDAGDKLTSKTSNGRGYMQGRFPKGTYRIAASKVGYLSGDTLVYKHSFDLKDTILLALKPVPAPVVYTFCGRVYSAETNQPLEAEVSVFDAQDASPLYSGTSTDDGLFVTPLTAGTYVAHFRTAGYMPLSDTVSFQQDTLNFYLNPIREGIRVKIDNLFFATNRVTILPESEEAMESLAGFMAENPSVSIRIIGHTDDVGTERANQILSEGRASSVRMELIRRGIDAARIESEGKGESEPVADNATDEGRALNRRVEFVITNTGGKDIQQITE